MWVKLNTSKRIEVKGKQREFHKGDWVDVGKHLALAWIDTGDATAPDVSLDDIVVSGAGIVMRGDFTTGKSILSKWKDKLNIWQGEPWLNYEHNLLWETSCPLRIELVSIGFSLLDKWQIAIPMHDYKILAQDIGSEPERELTKGVIRDLRVPVYDTRLIFVKRDSETRQLFKLWQDDIREGMNEQLSFLRALYQIKPLVLPLPPTWVDSKYE